jgi:hypothetical protein
MAMKVKRMPGGNCMNASGPTRIKIIGLNTGQPTEFDGKWLVEYDPKRQGFDSQGRPMIAHIKVTDDPKKAMSFNNLEDALRLWLRADGIREDGRPNRPLTAFTCDFTRETVK